MTAKLAILSEIIAQKMNMSEGAVKKSRQTIRKTLEQIKRKV